MSGEVEEGTKSSRVVGTERVCIERHAVGVPVASAVESDASKRKATRRAGVDQGRGLEVWVGRATAIGKQSPRRRD